MTDRQTQAVPKGLASRSLPWIGLLILSGWIFPAGLWAQDVPAAAVSNPPQAEWLSSLADGRRAAQAARKPLLIRAEATWCPACRALEQEIAKPTVQAVLADWTLVLLNVDASPDLARQWKVTVVPTLRIQTVSGTEIASRDGLVTAAELVEWLKEHRKAALAGPDATLIDVGKPGSLTIDRLTRHFSSQDPAERLAAIGRLTAHPGLAGGAVLKSLREGNLATRLTALELLERWHAPVDGLDPWLPETLTADRLDRLEQWCHSLAAGNSTGDRSRLTSASPLSGEALEEARREIQRMLKAPDDDWVVIRDRLAAFGTPLSDEVRRQLAAAAMDRDRERLRAAEELAGLAAAEDQALMLELFSDPDPLVRETSLQGLQRIGGKGAAAALANLLSDPEANVRAAVLKQLEENPAGSMVPRVAAYLQTETDPDLIVHATRFLRAAGGQEAIRSLIPLLKHESWQVRAAAADGLGHGDSSFETSEAEIPGDLQVSVYVALLDLLEDDDAFVVSRAVNSLADADLEVAVEPLVRAVEAHPDLGGQIVEILAQGEQMRQQAIPHLRRFARHDNPQIRRAALQGLFEAEPLAIKDVLAAALVDSDSSVRLAGAQVVTAICDQVRDAVDRDQDASAGKALEDSDVSAWDRWLAGFYAGKSIVSVVATLTAEWPLEPGDEEQMLIAAEALKQRIGQADLAGLKSDDALAPEAAELIDEMQGLDDMFGNDPFGGSFGGSYGDEEMPKGKPCFLYVARITEGQADEAMSQAFADAKQQAGRLARIAGVQLGPLVGLDGGGGGSSDLDGLGMSYRQQQYLAEMMAMGGDMAAGDENLYEATSPNAAPIAFGYHVNVQYALLQPAGD